MGYSQTLLAKTAATLHPAKKQQKKKKKKFCDDKFSCGVHNFGVDLFYRANDVRILLEGESINLKMVQLVKDGYALANVLQRDNPSPYLFLARRTSTR